jgi:hypothetical protein
MHDQTVSSVGFRFVVRPMTRGRHPRRGTVMSIYNYAVSE